MKFRLVLVAKLDKKYIIGLIMLKGKLKEVNKKRKMEGGPFLCRFINFEESKQKERLEPKPPSLCRFIL